MLMSGERNVIGLSGAVSHIFMSKSSYLGGGIGLGEYPFMVDTLLVLGKKITFLGSKILVMKQAWLNWVLVIPIILTTFGGLWLGSGFWMMFEFDGGFVGVGSNDTLPSSSKS